MKSYSMAIILLMITCSFSNPLQAQDTFSIVAVDPETGEVGSAGASCVDLTGLPYETHFLGELFPGIGAINTQAYYVPTNQINASNQMDQGKTPQEIIDWLINNDISSQAQLRQYGIVRLVNGEPQSAAHTGTSTDDYKGHITGPNYAIQGNILLGQIVLDSMEAKFLHTEGDLSCKLMAALQGANMVGADTRCAGNGTSSLFAFVKVAQASDEKGNPSFVLGVETKANEGVEPIDQLQALMDNEKSCITTIKNTSSHHLIRVFPNPAQNILFFEHADTHPFSVQIVNPHGKILLESENLDVDYIDIAFLSPGTYYLKILYPDQTITKSFVKTN